MGSSIFKTGSKLVLSITSAAGVAWWLLPLSFTRYPDINCGNTLVQQIDGYYRQHHVLPNNDDWPKLKQLGFTDEELEKASPEYRKVSNTAYELTFIEGFDGPYLMWNSQERKWKTEFPVTPTR